ncbi:Molybdopterin or thiamine biosynthesis adenylyltransferase [Luteibacter sp. UNC138MFCol5.1]|uniref:molybdopterin-synthase adenylyltransferase MoeB n=1 Tax=Luteibacter sp. UNC138MFCol5.1 TaxID=1502774 RepID=UPI0008CE27FC|nr:molybdopterin-synthase adenylyltransferase MoeB [Luteibacter sp. UNC138MFCol5.1]SEO91961.1 Molybdopterin or thiamine biosynthesis adenylyltransferase [Luteibacter sp. UNC138MFCol5.1]
MTEHLNRDRWLAELRSRVPEVTVTEALARQLGGALLVDVREDNERATGSPAGALGLSRGYLELRIEQSEPDRGRDMLLLCGSGQRSLLAADTLQRMGYRRVSSVAGGMGAWKAAGLPVTAGALDGDAAERYARQMLLPQVGEAGQAKLAAARIVVIGAGGLGAPALLYLAAAGVGHITVVDDDRVERSNLHRQVIHADPRVGMGKAESARLTLSALNPRVKVTTIVDRLRAENVEELIRDHDVVIDGADNFATRYLLAAATRRLGIPMVYAAIERFTGQASVFDPRRDDSPCYRCLFPEPPSAADAPNCSEAGVLGVLPGLVGMVQATEAMKLVLGLGQPLVGRLLTYDALGMRFRELTLRRDPHCPGCGPDARFEGYVDLERMCAAAG